jgi:2-dehydro-3-deoxyphosphogluconate aldolase/(4S)-4-hydroxy-2-oxoglutarate aldolase
MLKKEIMSALWTGGIVAVLRTEAPRDLVSVARALREGGVLFVEITLTIPGAIDIIRDAVLQLKNEHIFIGAGTVLDAAMAQQALDAGAHFIVGPGYDPETVRLCNLRGVLVMPGAFTPGEILNAWKGGADVVKLFPAELGGPDYIKTIKEPLPQIHLMPSKGGDLTTIGGYLKAGAIAMCIGGPLVDRRMIAEKDYAQIRDNAGKFSRIAREIRAGCEAPV